MKYTGHFFNDKKQIFYVIVCIWAAEMYFNKFVRCKFLGCWDANLNAQLKVEQVQGALKRNDGSQTGQQK